MSCLNSLEGKLRQIILDELKLKLQQEEAHSLFEKQVREREVLQREEELLKTLERIENDLLELNVLNKDREERKKIQAEEEKIQELERLEELQIQESRGILKFYYWTRREFFYWYNNPNNLTIKFALVSIFYAFFVVSLFLIGEYLFFIH